MKAQFSEEPDRVKYQLRPDGIANVWLRNNIEKIDEVPVYVMGDDEEPVEEFAHWQADEVFFTTATLGMLDVEDRFDELWEYYSSEETPIPTRVFSVEQNSRDANDAIAELSEIISELVGGGE